MQSPSNLHNGMISPASLQHREPFDIAQRPPVASDKPATYEEAGNPADPLEDAEASRGGEPPAAPAPDEGA